MKKFVLLVLVLIVSFSCNNDDDNVDCSLGIPEPPKTLFIDLIDTDGNNLIENETYNPEEIFVRFGNTVITGVVFTEVQEVENFIALSVIGQEGENTFEIVLNSEDTDTVVLDISKPADSGSCPSSVFNLDAVTYNDISQTIQDFNGEFLITVVRE